MPHDANPTTLHGALCRRSPGLPRSVVSKSVMVIASHLIEELVGVAGGEVTLVAHFQRPSHWAAEAERYTGLASKAKLISVLRSAAKDEWFVLAVGPTVNVVLCGLDLQDARHPADGDAARRFDAILSTDPDLVRAGVTFVAAEFGSMLPDAELRALKALGGTPPVAAGPGAGAAETDHLLAGMFGRIERLRSEERAAHVASVRLHDQALMAADRERQRLAEVLHDGSLQLLLAASQDLKEAATEGPAAGSLEFARESLDEGLRVLRAIVGDLYFPDTSTDPLRTRLTLICDALADRGGFNVHLTVEAAPVSLEDDHICALIRELLTNVVKHARAEHVTVDVRSDPASATIVVQVSDDGIGADLDRLRSARADGHIGLALAEERVRSRRGTWVLTTAPGHGVHARVTLPVAPAATP